MTLTISLHPVYKQKDNSTDIYFPKFQISHMTLHSHPICQKEERVTLNFGIDKTFKKKKPSINTLPVMFHIVFNAIK